MSKNVNITITGDNSSAVKALKGTADATEQMNDKVSESIRHSRNMKRAMTDAGVGVGALTDHLGPLGIALGVTLGVALQKAIGEITSFVSSSAKAFADFEQNIGGSKAVFGEYADTLSETANRASDTLGVSTSQYLATANKMGSLFKGAGFTTAQAMAMTANSIQRATDVASVMGITSEMALESVTGMAKGNLTMMDNLGVAMTNANLQAYALSKGLDVQVESMTTAERVGLAYQAFLEQTTDYAGNFAREGLETVAGSLQVANAKMEDAKAIIGEQLAPVMMMWADFVKTTLVPAISALAPVLETIIGVIQKFISVLFQMFSAVFSLFGSSGGATKKASTNTGKLATSTGTASSNLESGAGSAQKIADATKKASENLAGFDKVTVLKQDTPSSSGSGGGGGGMSEISTDMPVLPVIEEAEQGAFNLNALLTAIAENPFIKALVDGFNVFSGALSVLFATFEPIFNQMKEAWDSLIQDENLAPFMEGVSAFLGFVGGLIATVIVGALSLIFYLISNIITIIIKIVKFIVDAFVVVGTAIAELIYWLQVNIPNAIKAVGDFFKGLWDGIVNGLKALVDWFAELFTNIWNGIVSIFSGVGNWFKDRFNEAVEGIKNVFSSVGQFFTNIWNGITTSLNNAITGIKNVFNAIVTWISTNIVTPIGNFFSGLWNGITSGINGLKTTFENIFNTIANIVKTPINAIIDGINSVLRAINSIKIPDWVPLIGGSSANFGMIPKLARGGVVGEATLAMIGEAGAEAVVPLENNTGWVDKMASMLAEKGGVGGKGTIIDNRIELNGTELGRAIVELINDRSAISGYNGLAL